MGSRADRITAVSRERAVILIPLLLAIFFAAWSLRGVESRNVVDTDAARHAMNGAFVHDMVAAGRLHSPVQYGREYYSRLPALSMPYHPPVFPVVESVFFALFGVNLLAARLLIALTVAVSLLLLYGLVANTTDSHVAAACSVIVFYTWRISQAVSHDVMLEFPSLVLVLGALFAIRNLEDVSLWRWLLFAIAASAAVWTKQHALFLGGIPLAGLVLTRRWKLLLDWRLWLALGLFGAACLALAGLSAQFQNAGVNQLVYEADRSWFRVVLLHNVLFYAHVFRPLAGWAAFLVIAVAPLFWLAAGARPTRGLWLYVAWAASSFALLAVLGPYDERYLYYLYPPLLVIGFVILEQACRKWFGRRAAWAVPAVCTLFSAIPGLAWPTPFLHGPAEVASQVVDGRPRRVLYCGSTDGNFIFAVRALDSRMKTVVIRGEALLEGNQPAESFAANLGKYGITDLVIEQTARSQPCNALAQSPPEGADFDRRIPMTSSLPRFDGGTLTLYRVNSGSGNSTPASVRVRVPKIGAAVDLKY